MITRWYIGFTGDYEGRGRHWYDIFTKPGFRHVLALGYDPDLSAYVLYDPTHAGTTITILSADDRAVDLLILHVKETGCWLKVNPGGNRFLFGQWRFYCVPAIKHLVGLKSCALSPHGLYRDLVKAGAVPAFSSETNDGNIQSKKALWPFRRRTGAATPAET